MNKIKSLYIVYVCRVLLVTLFVLAPSKAVAGSSTTYYAKVTVVNTDTGAGTVYVSSGTGQDDESLTISQADSNDKIKFELHAIPNYGYTFLGWSKDSETSTIIPNPGDVELTPVADINNPASAIYYAHWQKSEMTSITIKINGSNFGSGDKVVFNVQNIVSPTISNTVYTVPLQISSSARISLKVPTGTYSVTPTAWAMNYNVTPVGSNENVVVTTDTEFEFNVVGKSSTGEYDEKSKVNWGN